MANYTILDCYTDEPAGLGVPPYLGTYPRYIAGSLEGDVKYITIDDLRLWKRFNLNAPTARISGKTSISVYNLTRNYKNIQQILENTDELIIIAGVHTPGKYLSALPASLKEIITLVKDVNCKKILTGPAVYGTSAEGGKFFEKADLRAFDEILDYNFSYDEIAEFSVKGAGIIRQIPDTRIIELETSKGCSRKKGCSFCTEPIKSMLSVRKAGDVIKEAEEFYNLGIRHFRLGKQSCFYSHPEAIDMLKEIRKRLPKIDVLHIDNVNPNSVLSKKGEEITKAVVKYCTPGNVAAFGVESFDRQVVEENNLNSTPENSFRAVKIVNKFGAERSENGMHRFLPGINLLFGLKGESRQTNDENMLWLRKIMKENLLLRRINIRQVTIFEGTPLYQDAGNRFIKKNRRFYWGWRKSIRRDIDFPMLQKIAPAGTILRNVRAEIYDGKTTFARQIGTYPLITGIRGRVPLKEFYDVKVTGHMLRSVVGEVV